MITCEFFNILKGVFVLQISLKIVRFYIYRWALIQEREREKEKEEKWSRLHEWDLGYSKVCLRNFFPVLCCDCCKFTGSHLSLIREVLGIYIGKEGIAVVVSIIILCLKLSKDIPLNRK